MFNFYPGLPHIVMNFKWLLKEMGGHIWGVTIYFFLKKHAHLTNNCSISVMSSATSILCPAYVNISNSACLHLLIPPLSHLPLLLLLLLLLLLPYLFPILLLFVQHNSMYCSINRWCTFVQRKGHFAISPFKDNVFKRT